MISLCLAYLQRERIYFGNYERFIVFCSSKKQKPAKERTCQSFSFYKYRMQKIISLPKSLILNVLEKVF